MITDTTSPQPASIEMPHGIQHGPAQALALACGVPLRPYDIAGLQQSLAAGQRCVVVWSSLQSAVAQALRAQTAPTEMVAAWRQSIESLLKLFGRFRRKLLLIDARVITQGTSEDLANLARRLPIAHALIAPDTIADLPEMLAQVIVGQLADLRGVIDELQASSLSIAETARTSADLDPVAVLMAEMSDDRARLAFELKDLTARHQAEGDMHRSVFADLSASLEQNAAVLEDTETRLVEAQKRAELATNDATQFRQELQDLVAASALVQSEQAVQIAAAAVTNATLEDETALLRDQLRDVLEVSAANLAEHSAARADATSVRELIQQEAALLREHLRNVSSRMVSVLSYHAEQLSAPNLASTRKGRETTVLRDQLARLSARLAAEFASSAAHSELDFARVELQCLTELLTEANAETSLDEEPVPQFASAELALLREQVAALHEEMKTQAAAVPSSDSLDYPQIEAAFATLLASLSAETELRKAAQQQSLSAALVLQTRSGGNNRLPMRSPIPPRPQTAAFLPFQNATK
jgi:hypothetical protein